MSADVRGSQMPPITSPLTTSGAPTESSITTSPSSPSSSEPSRSDNHSAAIIPAKDEGQQIWDSLYQLKGTLTGGYGPIHESAELPSSLQSSWSDATNTAIFIAFSRDLIAGFQLGLPSPLATSINSLAVTIPGQQGGSVTFNYPFRNVLSFLTLTPGTMESTVTIDDGYGIEISRSSSNVFEINLSVIGDPTSGNPTKDIHIELTLGSPQVPWSTVSIRFSAESTKGDVSGVFIMSRIRSD